MARTDFTERACSVARTLGLVGEQWSLLIMRDAFLGVRRFDARLQIVCEALPSQADHAHADAVARSDGSRSPDG